MSASTATTVSDSMRLDEDSLQQLFPVTAIVAHDLEFCICRR